MTLNHLASYQRLLALAETGLFYQQDIFDKERYEEIKDIALQLISGGDQKGLIDLQELLLENRGHPTPKVDVRALIMKADQLLLVEDRLTKKWALPGGFAEIGLTPTENVKKEVLEETGLQTLSAELIGIFDTNLRADIPQLFQYYKLFFKCTVADGSFKENSETSQMGYFPLDQLPPLSQKRTTAEQLRQLLGSPKVFCE